MSLKHKIIKSPFTLCRCGLSKRIPYCDCTHGCGEVNEDINQTQNLEDSSEINKSDGKGGLMDKAGKSSQE